ncbi:MAG: hypothetical protein NT069_32090 [Planctomycetota bacterium]|nr:hypothetical protein [Planctomycetota bacterium]
MWRIGPGPRAGIRVLCAALGSAAFAYVMLRPPEAVEGAAPKVIARAPYTVLGYNDLGMHCMNQDFSEMCMFRRESPA